ncbi:MAG: molecular chaperone HtpG [Cyclobacteriaceae bacterium]|nr:molecular chaperone HtpG [Cyclobacteriaceae bacterium]
MQEKGTISIHTENIFPIIKKFLYSDHEIFLRELVSNAVDASQKLQRLASIGEYKGELGELKVEVKVDKKAKTISIIDHGLGMTADEIKKYINQIAFSGATEFVEKYKDKGDASQIIGMFGLGFYSAFMVSKEVEIITKSFQEGAEAARWFSDGSTEFEITTADKKDVGTEVILHIDKDNEEFLEDYKIRQILTKYCKFLPVPIVFGEREETLKDENGEVIKDKKDQPKTKKVDDVINNPKPLWTKSPSDLKDEDYLAFYKELYPFSEDPLFWIHLNVDYPFNLTGILYFPKIKNDFELSKNKIQLYSKQVFITDEVKEIVPEFLMLLHGVLDSPDIPLNVSRSYLQADANVKKINTHITKKVADKLGELFKKDRTSFEKKWESLNLFVKYGIIADEKFYDKAKDFVLLENVDEKLFTFDEYKKHIEANQKDKDGSLVHIYTNDKHKQDAYIQSAKKLSLDVLKLDGPLDSHFVNSMEMKLEKTKWKRVDADIASKLVEKDEKSESVLSKDDEEKVKKIFEDAINDKNYTVQLEALAPDELPVTLILPEFMRRMKDMQKMGGGSPYMMMGNLPDQFNAVINSNHPMVSKILKEEAEEKQKELAIQAYELGLLSQNLLTGNKLTNFIRRSVELLG